MCKLSEKMRGMLVNWKYVKTYNSKVQFNNHVCFWWIESKINVSSASPGLFTSYFTIFTSLMLPCIISEYFHCIEVLQWLYIIKKKKRRTVLLWAWQVDSSISKLRRKKLKWPNHVDPVKAATGLPSNNFLKFKNAHILFLNENLCCQYAHCQSLETKPIRMFSSI